VVSKSWQIKLRLSTSSILVATARPSNRTDFYPPAKEGLRVLGDLLSGRLRQEMRQRVDAVLRCGNEWNQTAQKLIEALNKLTDSIQKGRANPADVRAVATGAKKLAKETQRLTRAFEAHNKTLGEILARY